jgi:glycosyltransferase involved in cell wall biosynthesis
MSAGIQSVVIIWVQFGPYHLARLEAAGRHFSSKGISVTGIEAAGRDSAYAWKSGEGAKYFRRVTLFPESDYQDLDRRRISSAVRHALDDLRPDCVAINGWVSPEALGALKWCIRNRRASVLMSDSKQDDFPRSWWKELLKCKIAQSYGAALVAGTPHRDYVMNLGVPSERVFLGYDVVDNEYFSQGASGARQRAEELRKQLGLPRNYFLAVTRFIGSKNVQGLLRAYRLYRDRGKGSDAWGLVISGGGPKEDEIKSLARELELSDVIWPGFIQIGELPNYYGLAGAFLLSSFKDSWGLVVNEAMAAGLPVLVSRGAGCCPDLVQDGVNGYTLDPHDADGMVEAMLRVSGLSQEARHAMGQNSAQTIAEWGLDRFAEGLEAAVLAARDRAKVGLLSRLCVTAAASILTATGA